MEAAESLFRCFEQLRVPGRPGKSAIFFKAFCA